MSIVRALLSDRRSQLAIGLFVGAFAYTVLALSQANDQSGEVPGLTMLVTYLLSIASIIVLVLNVHHAGQMLRVAGLVDLVGDELWAQLDELSRR